MSGTSTHLHMTRNSCGFSLVELAIALTVIGLLLAGLVKGKELMDNARLNRMVVDFSNTQAAMNNFKRIYNALPGDMPDAADRLPDCGSAPCNGIGNGDYRINKAGTSNSYTSSGKDSTYPTVSEMRAFWVQLAKLGMIDGIEPDYTGQPNRPGVDFPETPFGGGYRVYSTGIEGLSQGMNVMRPSVSLAGTTGDAAMLLTAKQAAQIDGKLDDRNPSTGRVRGADSRCWISSYDSDSYLENDRNAKCNIVFVLGNLPENSE